MRNKGSKDYHGRYSSMQQMQKRSDKLAKSIDKFIDQALKQHDFNKIVHFDKLHSIKDHLLEISKLDA